MYFTYNKYVLLFFGILKNENTHTSILHKSLPFPNYPPNKNTTDSLHKNPQQLIYFSPPNYHVHKSNHYNH